MASGCTTRSSSANSCLLDGEVLDHRLDDQIALGQGVEVVGGHDPAQDLWRAVRSSSLPFSTWLVEAAPSPATRASAVARCRERTMTSQPALAATSARPAPMIPDPRMPTRLMTVPAMGGCYRSVGFAGSRAAGTGGGHVTDDHTGGVHGHLWAIVLKPSVDTLASCPPSPLTACLTDSSPSKPSTTSVTSAATPRSTGG